MKCLLLLVISPTARFCGIYIWSRWRLQIFHYGIRFWIGDYEKEYFLGIDNLKKSKISDITLFQLNKKQSPYNDGIPHLIEVIMSDENSNGEEVKGKSTTDFIDYAILISNSKANTPIEEMD